MSHGQGYIPRADDVTWVAERCARQHRNKQQDAHASHVNTSQVGTAHLSLPPLTDWRNWYSVSNWDREGAGICRPLRRTWGEKRSLHHDSQLSKTPANM